MIWNKIYERPLTDRFNPFDNSTENRNYNEDYRKVVPQISMPDCTIPDVPSPFEKKRIKSFYNKAGGLLVIHFFGSNILAVILQIIASSIITIADKNMGFSLPYNYDSIVTDYITNSSISMSINLVTMIIANVIIFLIGCKLLNIKIPSLFMTEKFNGKTAVRYAIIGIFLQITAGFIASVISSVIENGFGITPYEADFDMDPSDVKMIMITVLYTCIIAPVTEELLFRGFLLKAYSKASQRVGIFATAFLFAIFHGNLSQGILAFIVGIFLATIVVRHNSLVPSIIVHMSINTYAMINSFIYMYMNEGNADVITGIAALVILFVGLGVFLYSLIKFRSERLPKNTFAQRKRGLRLVFSSWSTILLSILYIGTGVFITLVS